MPKVGAGAVNGGAEVMTASIINTPQGGSGNGSGGMHRRKSKIEEKKSRRWQPALPQMGDETA